MEKDGRKKAIKLFITEALVVCFALLLILFYLASRVILSIPTTLVDNIAVTTIGLALILYIIFRFIYIKDKYPNVGKDNGRYKSKYGRMPVNSRITIDYSSEIPSIKFGYPRKDVKNQVQDNSLTFLIAVGLSILTMTILTTIFNYVPHYNSGVPSECDVYRVVDKIGGSIKGFQFECEIDGKMRNITVNYIKGSEFGLRKPTFANPTTQQSYYDIWQLIFVFFVFIFWRKMLYFFFAKTGIGQKMFPEVNKRMYNAHFSCIFKPKHVSNNQVELPIFKNIYMDYLFTKEMGKYLDKVEIVEHPFNQLARKGRTKRRRKENRKNIYYWKAVFTFSKKPKNGKGEVRWT